MDKPISSCFQWTGGHGLLENPGPCCCLSWGNRVEKLITSERQVEGGRQTF